MLLREVIITLLVFGIVIAGATTLVGDITGEYDVNTTNSAFNATYNKISETQATTDAMSQTIESEGGFLTSAYDIIVKGTWSVLKMILGTLDTVKTMIYEMGSVFGLPDWFGIAVIGIIVVTIVTLILSVVMRKEI